VKTLGLIGGLTVQSTAVYYQKLHDAMRAKTGDDKTSELLMWSFNYEDVLPLYLHNKPGYIEAVADAGLRLRSAGADGLMILSNSAHMGAKNLADVTGLPVIHILDAIAAEIKMRNLKRPLVIGTDFVMEGDYYLPGLKSRVPVDPIVPSPEDVKTLDKILFTELAYGNVIDKAEKRGADSVILGCTEHCMLLDQSHHNLPMLDSTALHIKAAVDFQLFSFSVKHSKRLL
jgi:aspartate racemase